MVWGSNIMFPTDDAVLGITANYSQIKQIDPLLKETDSLWFISSMSPAIDSAIGLFDYVPDDFNGQQRIENKDIGADEYSSEIITRKPLTANDVGPFADDIPTSVEISSFKNLNSNSFVLYQNYPNPFNSSTTIRFNLPHSGFVSLKVFNLLGQEVASLVNEELMAGHKEVTFNASNYKSGLYFYKLNGNNYTETKKIMLLK